MNETLICDETHSTFVDILSSEFFRIESLFKYELKK